MGLPGSDVRHWYNMGRQGLIAANLKINDGFFKVPGIFRRTLKRGMSLSPLYQDLMS